jgi:O-antigen/teichoic acid export membrane protein
MAEGVGAFFESHKELRNLGHLAVQAGTASVAMQYTNGALQIIAAVVLARLLAPEDFGLVAIVTVVTSFAPLLIDFGLGDATTQRKDITQSQVSSLFWLSCGIGLAIALVVASCSPLIASVFREPRLGPIALYSAFIFVLYGAANQHLALLRRRMQFGKIAIIQIVGTLVGTVAAILMAVWGYHYWALVFRPIATWLCVVLGAWVVCPWLPGLPFFDDEVKSMVRFGLNVVGFSVVYTVAKALDRVGLGLFYRPEDVGFYQNATTLYDNSIFSTLGQLHTVGSAALSRLQSNPSALRQKYKAALSAMAFFVMPASAILSVTAQDLTVTLLGERWREAGMLLSILALRGIFQSIELTQGWLHLSIGQPQRWRNWAIVTTVVQLITIVGGLPFGAPGVAVAVLITSILLAVPSISYAGRPIGIGPALVVRAVGRQLIGAISAAAGGWWLQTIVLTHSSSIARIFLSAALCACIYLFIVMGLFRLMEPIKVASKILQRTPLAQPVIRLPACRK